MKKLTDNQKAVVSGTNRKALLLSICVGAFALIVYLIPSPIDPKPFRFDKPPPKLEGPLAPNFNLQKARKLFEGKVAGPESFAVDKNGKIYTGGSDGKIWGFQSGQIQLVAITGKNHSNCGSFELEPVCGRPKGMKVDKGGNLIVADAYLGLLKVSLPAGNIQVLIPNNKGLGGVPFKFLNGLDMSEDDVVYFTDSSTKWDRRHHKYEVIETNNYGRLFEYDLKTGRSKVLLSELYLASGVALSSDESYLLVSEMSVCRIQKYYLKGPKVGKSELLLDNLPGYPDNIRLNSRGNFYVGLASVRYEGSGVTKPFLDVVAPFPAVKRFVAKVLPFWVYSIFLPKHSMLLEITGDGAILGSHHDPTADVLSGISEGFQYLDKVYIGHFASTFIGEISVNDL
ncbi:adipocyte plasma membrane-associated protein-like [Liolophura sinensis]|uniref:adipocyte plasma membrane-associated protein-like n=1 Tax=Liolophura sinensis TaxID=3198878 RepID=UPI00315935E7